MAANTSPIFVLTGDNQWITGIVTANATADITSGTSYLVYTAPTDGGYVEGVKVKANPANNTIATVMRFWINNGSTTGTAANSALYGEMTIPATTASISLANPEFYFPMDIMLLATHRIYITVATAPGGSGAFTAIAVAGKYA